MIAALDLARLLADGRFDLSNEKACQRDIDTLLAMSLPVETVVSREHRLGARDRPDFLVARRIVIEVKMNRAGPADVLRQLSRYAAYEAVSDLILVTGKALRAPTAIGGKPLYLVSLGRAWL